MKIGLRTRKMVSIPIFAKSTCCGKKNLHHKQKRKKNETVTLLRLPLVISQYVTFYPPSGSLRAGLSWGSGIRENI